MECVSKFVS